MKLLFVADGLLDGVTVPRLVEGILQVTVEEETVGWARLHQRGSGSGYGRKLRFAIRQARDGRLEGVVATVDVDRERRGRRLQELQTARAEDRAASPHLPVALGEADPELEAWLLDDPVAVREALGLEQDQAVPTVRKAKNPKKTLEHLLTQGPRSSERPLHVWPNIAQLLEPSRCRHAKETGFADFQNDVRGELGPLPSAATKSHRPH